MNGRSSKFWTGCAVGCVVVVLLAALGTTVCTLYFRGKLGEIIAVSVGHEQLIAEYGELEDYTPPADGTVSQERLELFLEIREQLAPARATLEQRFADFPPDEILTEEASFRTVIGIMRELMSLLDPIAGYVNQRNELLLERQMGLGEYLHVYCTLYFAWLGNSPEDGPRVTKTLPPGSDMQPGDRLFDGDDSTFGPDETRVRFRRFALDVLQNRLESLGDGGDVVRESLQDELRRVRNRPRSMPWDEGLPDRLVQLLAPYRERAEASYSPTLNCFEIPTDEGGGFQVTID